MLELKFYYDFNTFGGKPKRDIEKIDECKIKEYNVINDQVELIVICTTESIAEKLKHYFSIRYEIFEKKN